MRVAFFAFAVSLVATFPVSADEASPRGVIELFTSQGCSSCPPADRLVSELARDSSNLVLTLPVDYWDYLGWKDTLASPANSARQRAYAMTRGDRKVYTPQIVVNGREAAVGSDGAAVVGAVVRAEDDSHTFVAPLKIEVGDGRVAVAVAAASGRLAEKHAEVWAFSVERAHVVQIARGENAGRTVTYANVVRKMTRLGVWDGAPVRFDVPVEEIAHPDADRVVVLVQSGTGGQPGAILGAARSDAKPAQLTPQNLVSRLPRDPL